MRTSGHDPHTPKLRVATRQDPIRPENPSAHPRALASSKVRRSSRSLPARAACAREYPMRPGMPAPGRIARPMDYWGISRRKVKPLSSARHRANTVKLPKNQPSSPRLPPAVPPHDRFATHGYRNMDRRAGKSVARSAGRPHAPRENRPRTGRRRSSTVHTPRKVPPRPSAVMRQDPIRPEKPTRHATISTPEGPALVAIRSGFA